MNKPVTVCKVLNSLGLSQREMMQYYIENKPATKLHKENCKKLAESKVNKYIPSWFPMEFKVVESAPFFDVDNNLVVEFYAAIVEL